MRSWEKLRKPLFGGKNLDTLRYPLTAVVGQEHAKRALAIALVNPRTGGLLISGVRGMA